ncbi:unnamed protein product [Caenorhabditis sp. 36 PRJEB53466]|nr:unnamed protein product [Caenorhabditis sp. 36 PRJEB53466]
MVAKTTASPQLISAGGRKKPQGIHKKAPKKLWVVKLQRIPYGFFERELLGYFRQFGNVLRIRVARSRKTGNHKGWAYVGFDDKSVAEIAAESMDGYLMFEQRIRCKMMKPTLIPKSMLKGPLLVMPPSHKGIAKKDAIARNKTTGKNDKKNAAARLNNLVKHLENLKNMGIEYDFPIGGAAQKTPVRKIVDDDVQVIATPKKSATPKAITPKATPQVTPNQKQPATTKAATPKPATPKAATPKVATPKQNKPTSPKAPTPKPETTKAQPPAKTPRASALKKAAATASTPVIGKKVVISEAVKTPQTEKIKKVENTPKFSPKTRAAKAAAAGTPIVKSTLSKTILKSVAASARPAVVEKKPVRAGRGKKKSL